MTDVAERIKRLRANATRADELEQAQAELPQAETDLSIAQDKLRQAQAAVEKASAEVTTRRKHLNKLKIKLGIPVRVKKAGGESAAEEVAADGTTPQPA